MLLALSENIIQMANDDNRIIFPGHQDTWKTNLAGRIEKLGQSQSRLDQNFEKLVKEINLVFGEFTFKFNCLLRTLKDKNFITEEDLQAQAQKMIAETQAEIAAEEAKKKGEAFVATVENTGTLNKLEEPNAVVSEKADSDSGSPVSGS